MKTKLLLAIAALGIALPGVASADPTPATLHHDKVEVRQERRELVQARHHDHWRKARHERRELAHAKHKLHHDRKEWREDHRR